MLTIFRIGTRLSYLLTVSSFMLTETSSEFMQLLSLSIWELDRSQSPIHCAKSILFLKLQSDDPTAQLTFIPTIERHTNISVTLQLQRVHFGFLDQKTLSR